MNTKNIIAKLNRRDVPLFPRFSQTAKFILVALIAVTSIFYVTRTFAVDSALKNFAEGKKTLSLDKWLGVDSQATNVYGTINTFLDVDTINPKLIQGQMPEDGRFFTSAPGGVIGTTNNLIGQLYKQPISGVEYIAQVKNEFLGIKPAYAQGAGFNGLQPILPIWKAFRNVVYIVSSLIFIAIGIMIMLRIKISPQAVISLQTAIPQLVTALILVTFSYAIAGLIIDISNFFMGMVLAILFQSQGKGLADNLFGPNLAVGIPVLGSALNPFSFGHLSDANIFTLASLMIVPSAMTILLGEIISWMVGFLIAFPIAGPVAGVVVGGIFGTVGAGLVVIVLIVLIMVWLFKFLLGLFKCYATLLFKIILAPLEIGMGAFPNSKMGFNTWLMDVVANLAVFPISLLFMVISNMIIMNILWGGFTGNLQSLFTLSPSTVGMWTPTLLGGDLTKYALSPIGGVAALAIGVSTLMLLSKLPDMIPQYIFMMKPSPWGTAIGEGLNPETMPVFGGWVKANQKLGETNRVNALMGTQNAVVNEYTPIGETFQKGKNAFDAKFSRMQTGKTGDNVDSPESDDPSI